MNRKTICILVTLLSFSVFSFAQAQHEVRVINGVEYYVYSVKQSEGLFRISQNFGVSQDEITRINPEVRDGLRVGQIILIPRRTQTAQTPPTQQTPPPAEPQAPAQPDPIATLKKMKEMLDMGLIEQAEYDAKKAEIMSRL